MALMSSSVKVQKLPDASLATGIGHRIGGPVRQLTALDRDVRGTFEPPMSG
jgi:hypothetical protein